MSEVAAFEDDAQQGLGRNPFIGEECLGETEIFGQEREKESVPAQRAGLAEDFQHFLRLDRRGESLPGNGQITALAETDAGTDGVLEDVTGKKKDCGLGRADRR